jgi:uncharacterized protein YjiS (DUF1127 family)
MAYFDTPRTAPLSAIGTARVQRVFSSPLVALQRWVNARRTEVVLARMTERELNDLGLKRVQEFGFRYSQVSARV